MEMDAKAIGETLRQLRIKKGKTLEEVSDDTGISVSALSMYETGERIPRDRFKVILADYYKRSIRGIFYN